MAAGGTGPMSDRMDDPTRLFYAILPDAPARARLDALAREAAERTGGRATRANTLHLTVVFVGTVPGDRVDAAVDAGATIGWRRRPIALDTLGAFARAGIAWAAPSSVDPTLVAAQRDLAAALAQRAIATEARAWKPHVTLARACGRPLAGVIDPPIAWDTDRVVLMASRLSREGPRYREIASWSSAR